VDWHFEPNLPLFIVQHPAAAPLKLAFDSEAVLAVNGNGTRVTYTTNTLGGSSGSPCFNQHLELVALHHAGDPDYTPMYAPTFNEGIPIGAIRQRLQRRGLAAGVRIE
jgi:V8-like Glu-specific endopeptidase